MIYALDTHTIAWYLESDPRLSANAEMILDDLTAELLIPTMVLVELHFLYVKQRIKISPAEIEQKFLRTRNCKIYPLDEEVVSQIPTNLDIHDSIIVATGLTYSNVRRQPVTLITKDAKITQSGLIQTLW